MIAEDGTNSRRLEVKIGLFLALALVACLVTIFYIGSGSDLFTPKYILHFTVDNGTGFVDGMPLKLSGFRIGRVYDIALNRDARVDVRVQIARKYQRWIRTDTVARLTKEGLIGDTIIELSAGSPGQPMLENGDSLHFEKTKSLEEHAEEIADKAKPVLMDLAQIINYINDPQGDFKQSLRNIQLLSSDLRQVRGEAGRQLSATVANLNRTLNKAAVTLDRSQDSLHAFQDTLGRADRAIDKVDGVAGNVDRNLPALLQRLDRILDNLEQTSANLRQASGKVAPQLPELADEVDTTVKEARQVLGAVKENWLIRNHLPPAKPLLVEGDSHE